MNLGPWREQCCDVVQILIGKNRDSHLLLWNCSVVGKQLFQWFSQNWEVWYGPIIIQGSRLPFFSGSTVAPNWNFSCKCKIQLLCLKFWPQNATIWLQSGAPLFITDVSRFFFFRSGLMIAVFMARGKTAERGDLFIMHSRSGVMQSETFLKNPAGKISKLSGFTKWQAGTQ